MPFDAEELSVFVDKLRALARSGDPEAIREELDGALAEDIAQAVERMPTDEAIDLLKLFDSERAGYVLIELPTDKTRDIVNALPDYTVAHYLDILPMDDAMDLREELGEERFDDLLEIIPPEDAQELRRLMSYPDESVGRMMTEAFFEVGPETSMGDLLDDIRHASEEKYETVNDVYVLSQERNLLGLFSLRRALRASPETLAKDIMREEPVSVNAWDEAEEAARTMARYGFYALPVLDWRGRMVGIFTGDDAQAVILEEDTKDVLALGGVSGDVEAYRTLSVWKLVKKRTPWLMILFVAEMFTGWVMRHYGQGGEINAVLFFMPLLIGAGGNSGSQATTMVTRALAIGEVHVQDWASVLGKEFLTAILVGTMLAIVGFARAMFWNAGPTLSLAVAITLPAIVIWATAIGSMLPLLAKSVKLDPAVMSAPFISTFVDATGLIIYFEIVKSFFHGRLGP